MIGLGIALGIPALSALCGLIIVLCCAKISDGFMLKAELCVVIAMDVLLVISQLVLALTMSSSSSMVGLLHTYRVGVATWLCLLLAVHLSIATRAHTAATRVTKLNFESIFAPESEQLKQQFTEHLHREFAGGLMMLWQDIVDFRKKCNEPTDEQNLASVDTPQANLRRDTVRKAKLGLHARSIWNKYLVANSPMEVDLEPVLLAELTNRINCNTISPTMFDTVQELVSEDMQVRFGRFVVPGKVEKSVFLL